MASPPDDFFKAYFSYLDETEVPILFNRWSAIASIGALLERNYCLQFGNTVINPNMYVMLMGSPGTRKSTAIKSIKALLIRAGYTTYAADRTSKEKFLLDLAGIEFDEKGNAISTKDPEDILSQNIFGESSAKEPSPIFITADEFNDFLGNGNIEFISMLGNLWDYNGSYTNRIKHGKSVSITDPTISILGGNTPTSFSMAFPPETFGQGFFSRLILVYGEPNGRKITFPKTREDADTSLLVSILEDVKARVTGKAVYTKEAEMLLDKIYQSWKGLTDVRFDSYSTRRFIHLLKLCLITSAARLDVRITEQDVIYSNTVLHYTERLMPKALGEFGKAKYSDISHKIIQMLDRTLKPMTLQEIWVEVVNDLEKMSILSEILKNLMVAKKIQMVTGQGFLSVKEVQEEVNSDIIEWSLLTDEERKLI